MNQATRIDAIENKISDLVRLSVDAVLDAPNIEASDVERAKVRLGLAHPSQEMIELLDAAEIHIAEALQGVACELINAALGYEDEQ